MTSRTIPQSLCPTAVAAGPMKQTPVRCVAPQGHGRTCQGQVRRIPNARYSAVCRQLRAMGTDHGQSSVAQHIPQQRCPLRARRQTPPLRLSPVWRTMSASSPSSVWSAWNTSTPARRWTGQAACMGDTRLPLRMFTACVDHPRPRGKCFNGEGRWIAKGAQRCRAYAENFSTGREVQGRWTIWVELAHDSTPLPSRTCCSPPLGRRHQGQVAQIRTVGGMPLVRSQPEPPGAGDFCVRTLSTLLREEGFATRHHI